jgi:cardiolipin synthase (CMP-forming)
LINKEIFYISNLLSLSRFVLLTVIVYFLITDNYIFASVFIVLLWLTDVLDGYIARKRNEISDFGKIIDPVADKISVVTISLLLLHKGLLPLWFFLIILGRDLIILAAGFYIKKKYKVVLQSNWIGKLTVFIVGLTLLNIILIHGLTAPGMNNFFSYHIEKLELYLNVLILISIAMSVFSLVSYFKKFANIILINK